MTKKNKIQLCRFFFLKIICIFAKLFTSSNKRILIRYMKQPYEQILNHGGMIHGLFRLAII